ncbi:replication protein A 32 kDa subunit B-like [Panicum virgatum]|uniref:replication protein A 32 kDa subunit B-like n=1 Tax=Panicum virgatum TaxID=38727 RepID=UPI0019D53187|nr:replication protein A 32 kDa subunit B-like [Panicum virgatum]XP_039834326.1 replication protein A 32 kDa subunit B-like [Panicum virgatum]
MHVTVKQIVEGSQKPRYKGRIVVNNSQVYTVQLCGMMCHLDHEESYCDYKLFDGTGEIKGRDWRDCMSGNTFFSGGSLSAYYVVHATVIVERDSACLSTLHARKVEDHNELTHHFLNCVTNHIELIRSKKRDFELRMTSYHVAAELDKEGLICLLANDSVRAALKELIDEGSIYNTVDDYHFKLAEN